MKSPVMSKVNVKPYYEESGIAILHGDSRELMAEMGDDSADLVLTDPPYGVGLKYGNGYDDDPEAYWSWFMPVLLEMRRVGKNVVFTHRQAALKVITDWDWCAVWNKPLALGFSQKGWLNHWEPIFVYGQPTATYKTSRRPATYDVFSFNVQKPNGHPAPKPLALYQKLVSIFDPQIVLDPFMGSGTTLVAAKALGRRAIGIEIEERYCELAANRLSQETLGLAV